MKKKGTAGEAAFQIVNYTIFGLFTLICILPFYYLFINKQQGGKFNERTENF